MGLSGIVLKKKEDVNIEKTINDIKLSATNSGLQIRMGKEMELNEDGSYCYTTVNIANTFEDVNSQEQMLMYVYNSAEDDYEDEFDWILMGGHLIQNINIEDISNCEKILLAFLYEYMKINPDDIFWDEMKWYYNYADIVKIHDKSFDKDWCYKK